MKPVVPGGNDNYCPNAIVEQHLAEVLPRYGVVLLMQQTSRQELQDLSSELPTDTHLVFYSEPLGLAGIDAVRSYSKSDIFDAYYDLGLRVIEISSGYGTIKPSLFQDSQKK